MQGKLRKLKIDFKKRKKKGGISWRCGMLCGGRVGGDEGGGGAWWCRVAADQRTEVEGEKREGREGREREGKGKYRYTVDGRKKIKRFKDINDE